MTPNQIESVKERINFLSRMMLAYVAGIYLLAGALGNHLMEWLSRDEFAWSEFGIVPAVGVVAFIVLSLMAIRQYRRINRFIDQIYGVTP